MNVQSQIEMKLADGLSVKHIEVVNESSNHNVPPDSESHFKLVLVAPEFEGKTLINRHRLINSLLADELKNQIHALAMHTYTEDEWNKVSGNAPMSPPCMGGGK
ncbi:MAG: BolA/IbaG family iron-sulfur metabolism protein [Gammaproteobacteria bacterium]|nr:BolA/IbaG family iron-sulfur metabolism protein [Gammaproteobacteria bacterium]